MIESRKLQNFKTIFFGLVLVLSLTVLIISGAYWYFDNRGGAALRPHEIYEVMKASGAPVKEFTSVSGETVRVDDFKGKLLIINFWASWCPPCVDEIPSLVKLREKYQDKMHVIAVSSDLSMDDIVAFKKSFPDFGEPNFTIVWDQSKALIQAFGIAKLPETIVIGPNGLAIKKIVGTIDWMSEDAQAFMDQAIGQSKQQ